MWAEALSINPRRLGVLSQHAVVNGPVGERLSRCLPCPAGFFRGLKQRPVNVLAVASGLQTIVDALQGKSGWTGTYRTDLYPFPAPDASGRALTQ